MQKRSLLLAALKKVMFYASDSTQLCRSIVAKIREFQAAGYPIGVLRFMCNVMYTQTQVSVWRYIAMHLIPTLVTSYDGSATSC